jgi:hypothetical protein
MTTDWERLADGIAGVLRQLPPCRADFELRTKRSLADWAILDALPRPGPSGDLGAVVEQRAGELTNLIVRWRAQPSALKRSEAEAALLRKFRTFAAAWEALPVGARPRLDWGRVKVVDAIATPVFVARAFRDWAREDARRASKQEIGDLLADVFFELTGNPVSGHYQQSTPFTRFVQAVFTLGDLGDAKHVAKHAADRFVTPKPA